MTLSALIKGKRNKIAIATDAIPAIHSQELTTVAKIAPVAIANAEMMLPDHNNTPSSEDDRRHCFQCNNLTSSGLCLAAYQGKIIASRNYHPYDHIPRRCEGYIPKCNEIDQRTGKERWPWLTHRHRQKDN
jgi:hypothetical protein